MAEAEMWHHVEARRDDGSPTMFRIRELDPRRDLTRIFVVELPYPITEMSRLPNAAAYRRLSQFEEQWLVPACNTLGWELVASKTEEGSFFLYMYGASDPNALIEKIAPFDGALGFYDDEDPQWSEYSTLRDLLDQAKAMPPELEQQLGVAPALDITMPTGLVAVPSKRKRKAKRKAQRKAKRKAPPKANVKANAKAKANVKATATAKAKTKAKANVKATATANAKRRPKSRKQPAANRTTNPTSDRR